MTDLTKRASPRPARSFLQLLRQHRPFQVSALLRSTQDPPLSSVNGYPYKPLPTPTSIRLLKLGPSRGGTPRRAKLIVVDLKNSPKYDCLSYVWGERTDPGTCICDNQEVSITRNLAGFLGQYCHKERARPIWIDSICINQDSPEEVSSQVALMGRIYSEARCVHIWLGNDDVSLQYEKAMRGIDLLVWVTENGGDGVDVTMLTSVEQTARCEDLSDAFRVLWRAYKSPSQPADDEDDVITCMSQFLKLLQHSWFERAWTFQESMLGKERQIHFGSSACDVQKVVDAAIFLVSTSMIMGKSEAVMLVEKYVDVVASVSRADAMLDSSNITDNLPPLNTLLDRRRGAGCQREQDIVFSLLGLASNRHGIIVDYTKSSSQLFYEIARNSLETSGCLDVLTSSIRSQERQDQIADRRLELPYWVPDWNMKTDDWLLALNRPDLYDCGKSKPSSISFSTDGKRLFVQGVLLARVVSTVDLTALGATLTDVSQNALCHLQRSPSTTLSADPRAILRTYFAGLNFNPEVGRERSTYEKSQDSFEAGNPFLIFLMQMMRPRLSLFTTDNGLLGRAPKTAQVGDIIAILWGHRVPFVLRKTPLDAYRVVGNCYVDEMMDGQAIKEEGDPGYEEYLKSLTTFVFD